METWTGVAQSVTGRCFMLPGHCVNLCQLVNTSKLN
jgi:hypothetical protein